MTLVCRPFKLNRFEDAEELFKEFKDTPEGAIEAIEEEDKLAASQDPDRYTCG